MIAKPNILTVIGQRIELRRAGKEHVGLCPFHHDRRPSLYVNEAKEVFLCRSCGEHGDVVDFVMKIDGLTFPEAKRALGVTPGCAPRPPLTLSRKRAAEVAASWVNEQRAKFNVMIADAMKQRDLSDEFGDFKLAEILDRELTMFRGFYDALKYPRGAAEMLALKQSIERITDGAEVSL
jgi:CHC2 zinc finger